jgi:hypothetical protein
MGYEGHFGLLAPLLFCLTFAEFKLENVPCLGIRAKALVSWRLLDV